MIHVRICYLCFPFKECPTLPDVEYGMVDLSQGNWEGAKATYICINNYALVGISTRMCESTGLWSGVQPECVFGKSVDRCIYKICPTSSYPDI